MKFGQIVRFRLGLKLFPQFTKILYCAHSQHTFDVDIIMNTILTNTSNIILTIPHVKQYILVVTMFQTTVYASKTHM